MNREKELFDKVTTYLNELGYTNDLIFYEYKTQKGARIDILVRSLEESLIAVEVKDLSFEEDDMPFHPVARKLQQEAIDVKAPVFIVTNGEKYIWLKTGDTGRPEVTQKVPMSQQQKIIDRDNNYVNALFRHVVGFLENFPITEDLSYDFSLILYAKAFKDLLKKDEDPFEGELNIFTTDTNRDRLNECLYRLESIDFEKEKSYIVSFLEGFVTNNKFDWSLPGWLSEFITQLYPANYEDKKVLDIYTKKGTLTYNLATSGAEYLESLIENPKDEYWVKFYSVLGNNHLPIVNNNKVFFESPAENITQEGSFDCVFVIPPFGRRELGDNHYKPIDSVELLLTHAIAQTKQKGYIIALVNDTFLFSGGNNQIRRALIENFTFKGIISLSNNSFRSASIRTSIVVLQKLKQKEYVTFFSSLEDGKNNIKPPSNLGEVKSKWIDIINNIPITESESGILVEGLDFKNLHFSNYWFKRYQDELKTLKSGFQVIPLKEVVEKIQRGSAIKKVDDGSLPYISPGMVRKMSLNDGEQFYTDSDLIKGKKRVLRQNDVVINIIGTQRGSAALVTKDYDGLHYNLHILSLEPNLGLVRPFYLALALNSDYVQEQLKQVSSGSVIPGLNVKSFDALFVPIPPLDVQDYLVEEYQRQEVQVNQAELVLNKERAKLQGVLNSLGKEGTDQ